MSLRLSSSTEESCLLSPLLSVSSASFIQAIPLRLSSSTDRRCLPSLPLVYQCANYVSNVVLQSRRALPPLPPTLTHPCISVQAMSLGFSSSTEESYLLSPTLSPGQLCTTHVSGVVLQHRLMLSPLSGSCRPMCKPCLWGCPPVLTDMYCLLTPPLFA